MIERFPARRAAELVARGVQVVDVREHHEIAEGTLPDAIAMPLSELPRRLHELRPGRPVAVVCRSGNRSTDAAALLAERGFRRIFNLTGGVEAARRS